MNAIAAIVSSGFNVGMMACLSIAYGHFSRSIQSRGHRTALLGALFGSMTVLSALQQAAVSETQLIGSSPLFVGCAAALFGPLGGLAALATAALLGLVVGTSSAIDLAQLALSALAGCLWSVSTREWDRRRFRALLLLGALMSGALLPIYVFAGQRPLVVSTETVLASFALNFLIAVVLGSLIERERSLLEGEQQLRVLAETDPLTGLHNRRTIVSAFAKDANDRLARALLLIDLDHFKSINDAHGHSAGDKVLRQIADQLRQSVRSGAIISRYGGEEFAILLHASSLEEAVTAAERFRKGIERHRVSIGQLALQVTASIGVAWWLGEASFEEKFKIADQSLYRAKVEGRNRVVAAVESKPEHDVLVGATL